MSFISKFVWSRSKTVIWTLNFAPILLGSSVWTSVDRSSVWINFILMLCKLCPGAVTSLGTFLPGKACSSTWWCMRMFVPTFCSRMKATGTRQAWESSPFAVGFVWYLEVPHSIRWLVRFIIFPYFSSIQVPPIGGSVKVPFSDPMVNWYRFSSCFWGTPFWSRARSPCWRRWLIPSLSLPQMTHRWNWDFVKLESCRSSWFDDDLTMMSEWCLDDVAKWEAANCSRETQERHGITRKVETWSQSLCLHCLGILKDCSYRTRRKCWHSRQ